ncbi:MAG: aldehyde ferredoxin oxidoreductase [Deltaproteobacteria bacterium]|jgi:aldehyde:ferredoxin oxidoreductase|nr:aldehyde ferredoxin oxidoreductase [Deltaproteobacteria bacterium]
MNQILRVDMTTGRCVFQPRPAPLSGLGGRGLTSALTALETPAAAEPLGPRNRLIFAPGLLGGTNCANSGRISVGAKSPLTGGVKEANSGGQPGGHLARLGLSALIVEGQAPDGELQILEISRDGARLVPSTVTGLNNYPAAEALQARYGPAVSLILIGRAGEMRLAASSVAFTDVSGAPTRHAGRGGLGAVMGAKGLKAVALDPTGCPNPPLRDPEAFRRAADRFVAALKSHPVCGGSLAEYGSAAMMGLFDEAGALPTRNFSSGRFERAEALSGERLRALTEERGGQGRIRKGCMTGCVMRCSGDFPDVHGRLVGKWPDFETLWSFGPNVGVDDLDAVARFGRLCDDLGVDTIDVGASLALLMEAGVLPFGDAAGALRLVEEIGQGSPLGRLVGSGAAVVGKVYGLRRVPQVKGQALSAFDPRSVKGQGATFATSPQGPDHTAGLSYAANLLAAGGDVDPLQREGQADLSRRSQVMAAAVDALGLCLFVSFAFFDTPSALEAVADMLNARHGWSLTVNDLETLGEKILKIELAFNRRAGLTEAADRLPEFFASETSDVHGSTFDLSEEELDSVLGDLKGRDLTKDAD